MVFERISLTFFIQVFFEDQDRYRALIKILVVFLLALSLHYNSRCWSRIITASVDQTCRLWAADTGMEIQTLSGHEEDIFSCAFNYEGDTIITGSKDNTCRIWKDEKIVKEYGDK